MYVCIIRIAIYAVDASTYICDCSREIGVMDNSTTCQNQLYLCIQLRSTSMRVCVCVCVCVVNIPVSASMANYICRYK